jgi:hypothetical protein
MQNKGVESGEDISNHILVSTLWPIWIKLSREDQGIDEKI